MNESSHTGNFFRQSGWMLIAGTLSGVFMYATHIPANKFMGKSEYGVFTTLLQVLNLMTIPAIGLQTVFAQQTAGAVTPDAQSELKAALRTLLLWTFIVWLVMALAIFIWQNQALTILQTNEKSALWITALVALMCLWSPIVNGILQGRQNFLWMGWTSVLSGIGRCASVAVILFIFGGYAAGAMFGAFLGMFAAIAVGLWLNRDLFTGHVASFNWNSWMRRVIPLTLGLGASQFMFSADMIVVRSLFDKDQTGYYAAVGMIGRALVLFTAPMMTVMFPKIVRSAARSEQSNALFQAFAATAFLAVGAAIGCTLFPSLPLRIIYDRSFLVIAPLVPWFAWCILPLTLANVLIGNLLARGRFEVVPWLVLVAVAYGAALSGLSPFYLAYPQMRAFQSVVQILGAASLLLLGVAIYFSWYRRPQK